MFSSFEGILRACGCFRTPSLWLFLLFLFFGQGIYGQGPTLDWVHSFGSYQGLERGYSLAADADGYIYIAGDYADTVDFDPGVGVAQRTSSSYSTFTQKLDSSGALVWVRTIDNSGAGNYRSLAIDTSGHVYTAGSFSGTEDFDPGPGTFLLTSAGNLSGYIQKLDAAGNFVWASHFAGVSNGVCYAIATDSNQFVYATGYFADTVDFDPAPLSTTPLISNGNQDVFVIKLDPSGQLVWVRQFGGTASENGNSVAVDKDGAVYTTGRFRNTVDFDPGVGVQNLTATGSSSDSFVLKLDANGNFAWVTQAGGSGHDQANSILVNDSNQIYVAGYFQNTVDFDPGPGVFSITSLGNSDGFVQKLDSTGQLIWVKTISGSGNQRIRSIESDLSGNIYVSGLHYDTTDFAPGPLEYNLGTNQLPTVPGMDAFFTKWNSSGQFIWAESFGSNDIYSDKANAVVPDIYGNVYGTGRYGGFTDFAPGPAVVSHTPVFPTDIFILKYISCTNSTVGFDTVSVCGAYTAPGGNNTWTSSGNYVDYLTNAAGCDSVLNISLTITGANTVDTINATTCDSLVSPSGNYTWFTSGTYQDTIPGTFGCDTNRTVHLTVLNSSMGSVTMSGCDSVIAPSGNYTWYTSGNYNDTVLNQAGCDSVLMVSLTINSSSTSVTSMAACGSMVSPSGNFTWSTSGIYQDTILTQSGCDSVMTINLTIGVSSSSSINLTSCDSLISPSGKYTWSTEGTFLDTISNQAGCDSLLTINFSIVGAMFASIIDTACDNYTSPGTNQLWTSSGIYSDTLISAAGCDSIIIVDLTILPTLLADLGNDTTICSNDSILIGQYISSPGSNFLWNTGSTAASIWADGGTTYSVLVDRDGCLSADSIVVDQSELLCPRPFPCVPQPINVFTPNNDGINEVFEPWDNNCHQVRQLTIFNQWGQSVYAISNANAGWDGHVMGVKANAGVYYYLLEFEDINNPDTGVSKLQGFFHLMR